MVIFYSNTQYRWSLLAKNTAWDFFTIRTSEKVHMCQYYCSNVPMFFGTHYYYSNLSLTTTMWGGNICYEGVANMSLLCRLETDGYAW